MNSIICFCLVLVATNAVSDSENKWRLIYALQDDKWSTTLYETGFNSFRPKKLDTIPNYYNKALNNLFISRSENGTLDLCWDYKNLDVIGCYRKSDRRMSFIELKEHFPGFESVFLGPGDNGKLYVYLVEQKSVVVFNNNDKGISKDLSGIENIDDEVKCIARDPCDEKLVFFITCSGVNVTLHKFNIETYKLLEKEFLPNCFDAWRIMPKFNQVFATKDNLIYKRQDDGTFIKHKEASQNIVGFAVGDNKMFFSVKDKIYQLTGQNSTDFHENTHNVKGTVTAMAVYYDEVGTTPQCQMSK